jgi:hypothetical protein
VPLPPAAARARPPPVGGGPPALAPSSEFSSEGARRVQGKARWTVDAHVRDPHEHHRVPPGRLDGPRVGGPRSLANPVRRASASPSAARQQREPLRERVIARKQLGRAPVEGGGCCRHFRGGGEGDGSRVLATERLLGSVPVLVGLDVQDPRLHDAVWNKASLEVVEVLVQGWDQAVRKKGQDGKLPLHCAAEKHPSLDVVTSPRGKCGYQHGPDRERNRLVRCRDSRNCNSNNASGDSLSLTVECRDHERLSSESRAC